LGPDNQEVGINIYSAGFAAGDATSLMIGNVATDTKAPLHVLTLTPFYPASGNDAPGCFVAEPQHLLPGLGIATTVMAVQPFYRTYTISSSAFPSQQVRYISLPGGFGLPSAGALLFANLLRTVRELHRVNPIQVIHAHGALPCGHAAGLLSRELGIPFVVTVHGLDAYSTNQVRGRAGRWCQHVSRWVYGSAASVICISEKVRDAVLQSAGRKIKTEVIYNGVDVARFHPAEDFSDSVTILSVGNLIPVKGHELLLRAYSSVHARFPDSSCEIIGDGPERTNLVKLAADLGVANKIIFAQRKSREEIAQAMRRCTILALPSSYEGLGCVYLEAMASGKPAIGCHGQGIDEVIEHGVNGWLITPGSLDELTQGLTELTENKILRDEIGFQARQTIVQSFTLAHQAARLANVYRECAS
jgi:teichuronic acid biosynthesis glycosyltransferase TuaC